MAKVLGPDFVLLHVRDLATSRRFYTELLGLTPSAFTASDTVAFDTKPIPFAIAEQPDSAFDAQDQPGAGVVIWLNCDDVEALHASLVAAGVTILKQPEDTPFGRRFAFRDPNGYELIAYKAIPLDEALRNFNQ